LHQAIEGIVPPAVLARKKKGFGIPISAWLKKWPNPDRGRTADMGMDFAVLSKNWRDHRRGAADHRGVLFLPGFVLIGG
jgi:asparagine synthase (glutamine-hydrolysing)